jgi:hypothetical protein
MPLGVPALPLWVGAAQRLRAHSRAMPRSHARGALSPSSNGLHQSADVLHVGRLKGPARADSTLAIMQHRPCLLTLLAAGTHHLHNKGSMLGQRVTSGSRGR